MRALAWIVLALALSGSATLAGPPEAPLAANGEPDAALAPAAAIAPPSCPPAAPETRLGPGYVGLRWVPCDAALGYRLLRGDAPDAMELLVEVAHPGFVDVGVRPGHERFYAVETVLSDGALVVGPVVVAGLA